MTTPDLKQARELLEELGAGRGGRVSAKTRREVLVTVEASHVAGLSYKHLAEALGIPSKLLGQSRQRERHIGARQDPDPAKPAAEFAAVRVPLAAAEFVVHGPCGIRIEGLSIEARAELCRRLA